MELPMRVFSYGGGVQSTAALVLAVRKEIDFPTFAFANVGDDSEHPKSLDYVNAVAKPYAEQNGIQLVELRRTYKDGRTESLIERINRTEHSIPIPVRLQNGSPANRVCTQEFKINVVDKFLRQHGCGSTKQAIVGLGISIDEYQRMRTDSGKKWKTLEYPLIDLRLSRQDCMNIITSANLPMPQKSSCYFCPFHSLVVWQNMRRDEPELFWKSVALEQAINDKRQKHGKHFVYFTNRNKPLDQVITNNQQLPLIDDDDFTCDTAGYCMM